MYETWDLAPLYKDFDDPRFTEELTYLQQKSDELIQFVGQLSTTEPLEGLRRGTALLEAIEVATDRLALYPRLRIAADASDSQAIRWQERISSITAAVTGAQASYKQWAGSLPKLMELLKQDEILQQYRFYYSQIAHSVSHLMSSQQEQAVAAMNISGGKAWANFRGAMIGSATAQFRGQTMTLTSLRHKAGDPEQTVRREAFQAELDACRSIALPLAHAMNATKQATITECNMRGYESVLDWSLQQQVMQPQTLEAMLSAVQESLPKLRKYLKAKAQLLGHRGGIPWYDISAPISNAAGSYTPEQARDQLLDIFYAFDADLGRMIQTAFQDRWIDIFPRSGKRDGAFCASSKSMGRSWVLANFSGRPSGISTFAHELGHAFHNQCIQSHRPLNKRYSRPVSETASIFNEFLVSNNAIDNAKTPEEKLSLVGSYLSTYAGLIIDVYSRFLFEREVFCRREKGFLSPEVLCRIMEDAQKEAYGDALDPQQLHPYMWICKPHYYAYFYYNYPYIFGTLFSLGLYTQYEKEGAAFVPKYKELLRTTTIATVEDAAKVADIDLTTKDFWQTALQKLGDMVDQFCILSGYEE